MVVLPGADTQKWNVYAWGEGKGRTHYKCDYKTKGRKKKVIDNKV